MKNHTYLIAGIAALALCQGAQAQLTHRYSFTTDASDSVGGANGTLMNVATVAGGQLQFNNPNFSGTAFAGGHLVLPASILPSSGSVTIEQWFTFSGSGFFTEAWTFSDRNGGANPPGASMGQYLMHTISAPQGGPNPSAGGSHVAQATAGWTTESAAFGTTTGLGFAGGGYLDDGATYMAATVIDGGAGTLSYYVYRVSDGLGGLQQTIAATPLSSYSFTDAFLGRSAFDADNWTSGSVDEFRIFTNAKDAAGIAADFAAGPNVIPVVPEPTSLALIGVGALALMTRRRIS